MTTATIAPTTRLDDLHPARFLKVTDLVERWKVSELVVTISRMTNEDTIPNPKDIDPATSKPRVIEQPVLYFKTKDGAEFRRGYLLSAGADVQSLKSATNAQTVAEVIGKKIRIKLGQHRQQTVLRIDAQPVKE